MPRRVPFPMFPSQRDAWSHLPSPQPRRERGLLALGPPVPRITGKVMKEERGEIEGRGKGEGREEGGVGRGRGERERGEKERERRWRKRDREGRRGGGGG